MVGGTARFLISGSSDSRSSQHNGLISLASRISKILYSFVQSPLSLLRHTQKANHMEKRETLHFSLITCIKKVRFSLLDCVCTAHCGTERWFGVTVQGREPKFSCQFQSSSPGLELALLLSRTTVAIATPDFATLLHNSEQFIFPPQRGHVHRRGHGGTGVRACEGVW